MRPGIYHDLPTSRVVKSESPFSVTGSYMGSKNSTFLWEGDRDRALTEARRSGCALDLWFRLAEQRAKSHQEFSAWLKEVHGK
jgi:hypothetical protein